MPKQTHVRMVHTGNGQDWDSPIAYVERAKEKGYRLADGESIPEPPTPFDPSAHSVEDVQAHLATASPDETERVLAAERTGKNRTTITGD